MLDTQVKSVKFSARLALAWLFVQMSSIAPVFAHVKWFLDKSEAEILRQPKPELFQQLSFENAVPALVAFGLFCVTIGLSTKLRRAKLSNYLLKKSVEVEPLVNLVLGISVGGLLIYCGLERLLLAPNFVICSHCPQWLPSFEVACGISIALGILARLGACALIYLLMFAFFKHSFSDCLDLFPLYGTAIYFLIAGRGLISFDYLLRSRRPVTVEFGEYAHLAIRWGLGFGLMILGLDEKLLHPQLALELLKLAPSLNVMHSLGMSNETFVLYAGLTEVALGLILVVGSFPRLAVLALAGLFVATSTIFGAQELLGHLPYYGMIFAIALRGKGLITMATVDRRFPVYLNRLHLRYVLRFQPLQ